MGACYEHLSYVERLSIDEGRRCGLSIRAIARRLGRTPSTVSRDLRRIEPWQRHYDAPPAFFAALRRRSESRRGRRKLIAGSPLFEHVASLLRAGWSPLQLAGRLRRMDPDDRPRITANYGDACNNLSMAIRLDLQRVFFTKDMGVGRE